MKKLSYKQKIYWINYAKRTAEHSKKRSNFANKTFEKRLEKNAQRKKRLISAPEYMDLDKHYEETVSFFKELRSLCLDQRSPFKIDFVPIKSISPAAALIFTAEIDRIMKTRLDKHSKLFVTDFRHWNKLVQLQLRDMGMFELLNSQRIPKKFWKESNSSEEKFLKFQSGKLAIGDDVKKLKVLILRLTQLPKDQQLQAGLTEAMTNSIHHAYPDDYLKENMIKEKLWWMSASVNLNTRFLTVMFYDEGVGIPKTLPKTWPETIKNLVGKFGDAEIIQAATKVSRTSTNQQNRGKGLKDIKNYIDMVNKDTAELKIYSLSGYYRYQNKKEFTFNYKCPILGTFIQWQIPI